MDAEKVNPWRQVLQERKSWVGTKWSLNEFEMFFSPTKPILSQDRILFEGLFADRL